MRTRWSSVFILWSASHFLMLAAAASGEAKRSMSLVDLLEVPVLTEPRLSPSGDEVVFVLAEADWEENKRISHLWLAKTDDSGRVQLTNGTEGESGPRWSPDGRRIAFIAKRADDEEQQIYVIEPHGGESERVTEHATAVSMLEWAPDGASIYFLAADPKTTEEKDREEKEDDVLAFDEDYKQRHLWRVSVGERVEEKITEGDYSMLAYNLSLDGARIAFHRAPTPLFDDSDESEIWVMDSDGEDSVRLTDNAVVERGAELSPDNSVVLFRTGSNEDFDTYYNGNLFVVNATGGEPRLLLPELPHGIDDASWSADGESIYFVANTGVRRELFAVDVTTEKLTQLTEGDHTVRSWTYVSKADRHVFSIAESTNPGDVWTLPATANRGPRRATNVFGQLSKTFVLPRQEAIQWKGADGVTVEGLFFYPLDYEPGRRYPLVVQTHGGPASSDKFGFPQWRDFIPVLAAKGYVVLKPNYRGSTGYGDPFLRDMVGHYYQNAHLDVMAGVDYVIELGIADGERMAKMGWSGGGHMTNKIITYTDRFKAASSGAGAVNWISMYGQSDVRIYRTPWFGGTPWQKDAPIEVYWEHSPLKDIWKVKTPTIVLVGENDVRVPSPQSVELYRALRTNGVPTHLYIAPREPHGWRELRHELFKMNVELDWFEKYVLGREYEWEEAPSDEEDATSP